MAQTNTAAEILSELKKHGVDANESNIAYYRLVNDVQTSRYEHVVPADTFTSRIGQYIEAIRAHTITSWNNRSLGMRGAAWARCATTLCNEGFIEVVAGTRPVRYERVVEMGVIDAWYDGVDGR